MKRNNPIPAFIQNVVGISAERCNHQTEDDGRKSLDNLDGAPGNPSR